DYDAAAILQSCNFPDRTLMDLAQLKQILDLVREHELSEFEIESEGLRLKIRKEGASGVLTAVPLAVDSAPAAGPAAPSTAPVPSSAAAAPPSADAADLDIELAVVKSPIV